MVALIAGDAIVRGHFRPDHFQEVELGGHLEDCAGILGHLVHGPHVADDHTDLSRPVNGAAPCSIAQIRKRQNLELADAIGLSVDQRLQSRALTLSLARVLS